MPAHDVREQQRQVRLIVVRIVMYLYESARTYFSQNS